MRMLASDETRVPVATDAARYQRELCNQIKIKSTELFDLFPVPEPAVRVLAISASASEVATHTASANGRSFVGLYFVGCVSYYSSYNRDPHQTLFS